MAGLQPLGIDAARAAHTRRPLRVCFVAYRGNMQCGGQGVYLWFLVRELARLGHQVDVVVGPPYPDPMPFARWVHHLPNERFWGKWFAADRRDLIPRPHALKIFQPLNFYELAMIYGRRTGKLLIRNPDASFCR